MEKFQWKSESKNVKVNIFSDTGEARAFLLSWKSFGGKADGQTGHLSAKLAKLESIRKGNQL